MSSRFSFCIPLFHILQICFHGTGTVVWCPSTSRVTFCRVVSHYCDVKMGTMASQLSSVTTVSSIVHSGADQRKLRVNGLCVGNSTGTGEFPAQMAKNAKNISIWLRHHKCQRHNYEKYGHLHLNCPVASLTKEVNPWLAKGLLVFNRRLANRGLTFLVKETRGMLILYPQQNKGQKHGPYFMKYTLLHIDALPALPVSTSTIHNVSARLVYRWRH